jgi:hypothetical protein
MQIGGIAWWLLVGMFGLGAAVGLCVSLLVAARFNSSSQDWGQGVLWLVLTAVGIVVAMPLAGIVAVVLTFAMHRAGWERPLPYLAGSGLVFLTLVARWIVSAKRKSTSTAPVSKTSA